MSESRTRMTSRNAVASIINRVVVLICNFVGRSVFVHTLSKEYLGVGGMFGNVFSIISLLELGFGEAASQAMYKPLAERDMDTVRKIVKYFLAVYRYVAFISATIAILLLPFLPRFFPDIIKIQGYRFVYVLFIVHQTLSYLFAPKRSLVLCDQRMYVVMSFGTVCSVFMTVSQIFALRYTGNYLVYIFLRIFFIAVSGIFTEVYADRKYGFNQEITDTSLPEKIRKNIKSNTVALCLHKIGGVINNSTDSILLSSCLGLSLMGMFSNYSLIINSLGSFISLAVSAASASIGNLGAGENERNSEKVLSILTFANFYLLTNCSAILLAVINPIITLWLGDGMCFSTTETAVIISCFYMSYIRDPVQLFLRGYGVFKNTKFIPLVRGIINLVLSYIFVRKTGVSGVFAGTLISTLAVPFLTEPYMLFKYGFGTDGKKFTAKYVSYIIFTAFICSLSTMITGLIKTAGLTGILLKCGVTFGFVNIVLLLVYGKSAEMRELTTRVTNTYRLIQKHRRNI